MDIAVKQRLIGAFVLAALAMIFLPMVLPGSDVEDSDASAVPLTMPASPNQKFETRELALELPKPASAPADAAITAPAATAEANPDAVVTVESSVAAPRQVDAEVPTVLAIDAATGEPLPTTPTQNAAPAPTVPAASNPASTPAPVATTPAPTPVAAPAEAPISAASGGYAVNVGSFGNVANARALEAKLRAAGLAVQSENLQLSGKPALRLRVGPYAERAAAEAARLRVQGIAGNGGQVIALDGAAASKPVPSTSAPTPAPTATAPSPVRKPLATAGVGFAVQLGALRVEADAIALRDRARAAGFVAFHQRMETESGVLFRVRLGPEADRVAAEAIRRDVATKLGITGLVVPHP